MKNNKYLKSLATLILLLVAIYIWLFWPQIVARANGLTPLYQNSCSKVAYLAQLGDSYGSFNSLLTLIVGIVAIFTLLVQQKQLIDINHQNMRMNLFSLISAYYQVNETQLAQRCQLLHSLAIEANTLPDNIKKTLIQAVKPTPQEIHQIRSTDFFKNNTWIIEEWSGKTNKN